MAYTSIVDYLKSVGQASDYNSRATLAAQKGITNYAGTAEQNTQLLGILQGGANVPTSSVWKPAAYSPVAGYPTGTPAVSNPNTPIDAGAIVGGNTPNLIMPTTEYPKSDITDAQASYSGWDTMVKSLQDQMAETQKKIDEQQTANQTTEKSWYDKIFNTTQPTTTDYVTQYQDLQKQLYPNQEADLAELKTLNDQYAVMEGQKQQAIADAYGRTGVSQDFTNNTLAQINRNADVSLNTLAAKINTKSALISANQGNMEKAMDFVNKAVDSATAEQKFEYEKYRDFVTDNNTEIQNLRDDQQQIFLKGLDMAQQQYDDAKAEKTDVGNLMIKYNQYGANISLDDSLATAQQKAASVAVKATAGGLTAGGLTADQEDAIRIEMANLSGTDEDGNPNFTNRDEAFKYLDRNNALFRRVLGEAGYVQLRMTAESLFPKPAGTVEGLVKPSSGIKISASGTVESNIDAINNYLFNMPTTYLSQGK